MQGADHKGKWRRKLAVRERVDFVRDLLYTSAYTITGDMTIEEPPVNRSLSKSGQFILIALVIAAFWVIDLMTQPQLVPGQKPLTDINDIETLRAQFNRDSGKTRLIILVSPT